MKPTRIVGVFGPLALLVAVLNPPALAQDTAPDDEFVLGTGGAAGTVARAGVFFGGLPISVPFGQAVTTYEGRRARALGAVVNASGAGALTGTSVEGTEPLAVDSQGDGAKKSTALVDPAVGTVSLEASDTPQARSEVAVVDVDMPGLIGIKGGQSSSSTQIVDGRRRVAAAKVSIDSVSLGDGLVELQGLRWEVSHESAAGPDADTAATFTVGAVSIAGIPVPVADDQLGAVAELVNSVLGTVGLRVILPEVAHLPDGSVNIGSLRVRFADSIIGSDVIGPLLGEVRPALLPVIDALVSANSDLGLVTLLLDLGLGVADGSGGFEVSIGGANALTDGSVFDNPLAGAPSPSPAGPGTNVEPETAPAPAPVPSGPAPPRVVAPTPSTTQPDRADPVATMATSGPSRCTLAASPRRRGGCRSAHEAAALAAAVVAAAVIGAYEVSVRRRGVAPETSEVRS